MIKFGNFWPLFLQIFFYSFLSPLFFCSSEAQLILIELSSSLLIIIFKFADYYSFWQFSFTSEFFVVLVNFLWRSSKQSARNAGDVCLIPGLGRFLREGNGNPLQYSCLKNPTGREAWWAIIHGVAKSRIQTEVTEHGTFQLQNFIPFYNFDLLIVILYVISLGKTSLSCFSLIL